MTDEVWENLHTFLVEGNKDWLKMTNDLSVKFNTDKKGILKNYFNFIIKKKPELVNNDFLTIVEMVMHSNDSNIYHILDYFISHMKVIVQK